MKTAALILAAALAFAAPAAAQQAPSSIATKQVTVAATATLVVDVRRTRVSLSIENLGTTQIFCGADATVTTSTGYAIAGVAGTTLTLPATAAVYCITSTGTQAVSVIESIQ